MPPCRPQMLHQLQTSSFLRSPSFPSSRPPQIEKERQGDICRIQTYHIPSHSPASSRLPSALIFSLSPFRRLSTRPWGDDIGYTVVEERKGRDTRQTRQRRRSSTRHEFSIKFNTGRKRTQGYCTLLFQVIEQSEGQRKKQEGVRGERRGQGWRTQSTQRRLILFLGLPRWSIISSGVLAYMKY